jgi:PAS domain S-box-containing protein
MYVQRVLKMNIYAFLTLMGFSANVILGTYILYSNHREKLNRLYAMVAASLAVWSIGTFFLFIATTPQDAVTGDRVGCIGALLTISVLLYFYMAFVGKEPKKKYIPLMYLPTMFFLVISTTTDFLSAGARLSSLGVYSIVPGVLYLPYTLTIVAYALAGMILCIDFYMRTKSQKEKTQAKLLILSLIAPVFFGTLTDILPEVTGTDIIPLTPITSTITAIIIAYAMLRHGLMTITPGMAAENIIENMMDYLVVTDNRKNITLVNDSCLNALGYGKGELKGKHMNVVFPDEKKFFEQIARQPELKNYETKIMSKDKTPLSVSMNCSRLRGKSGNVAGFVLVMRDLRETEKLKKSVIERSRELSEKIDELTKVKSALLNMMEDADKANIQLSRSKKEIEKSYGKLKEVDVKKDEFISVAAHELKTPLTAIHGFSQLLKDEKVLKNRDAAKKYLDIMDKETGRLSNLVTSILELSRADLGTLKFLYEKIDLKDFVGSIISEMQVHAKQKGLHLDLAIDKGADFIETDREKLTQILINLINNSVKYTPKGWIKVIISREGDNIHFSVKDSGVGIAKENIEKLFHRFYQVDSTYTRKVGGTGLGLSICKEYVEAMGGRAWVESELGKGSTFHVVLPAKQTLVHGIKLEQEKTVSK